MPKVTYLQTNFTAGEVSPRIFGRVDISRYQNGAETMENCFSTVHGGAPRRGGFRFVAAAKYADKKARLVPFVFSRTQAYILEMGDLYMRVFKDRGQVTSGLAAYEIATPYTEDMVQTLDWAQGKDTMFIFSETKPIYRLRRFDHDYWDCSPAPFEAEPFDEIGDRPAIALTLSDPDIGTGRTVTAASAIFLESDVGRTITSEAGLLKITAYTDSTHVTGEVVIPFKSASIAASAWVLTDSPQSTITPSVDGPLGASVNVVATKNAFRSSDVGKFIKVDGGLIEIKTYTNEKNVVGEIIRPLAAAVAAEANAWSLNASIWNDVDGYPITGTLYQQRLVVGGSPGYPQRYSMSRTALSLDFTVGVEDTDAFSYDIESDEANQISYLSSTRTLVALTYGGEFTIDGGIEKPITPTNPQVRQRSNTGCARVRPVRIKNEEVFVQRSGLCLNAMSYNTANDDYLSPELTTLSEHITESGITCMAYQQRPHSILWCTRNDGQMATLTLERDQEVVSWSRQVTDGEFESVACIPNSTGDDVWVITKRTVNGQDVRYVELYDETLQVDSGISGEGLANDVWGGFDHLEGRTAQVVAEGCYIGDFVVSGGYITLPRAVTNIQAGLGYITTIRPLTPEIVSREGSAQGAAMHSNKVSLRLLDTYGVMVNGKQVFAIGSLNQAPELFSGIKDVSEYGWAKGASDLVIQQTLPMPFHLLGIIRSFTVNQG